MNWEEGILRPGDVCLENYLALFNTKASGYLTFCRHICNKCASAFKRKDHLKRHNMSMHGTECPFKCSFGTCKKEFKLKERLKLHLTMHSGPRLHICKECGKREFIGILQYILVSWWPGTFDEFFSCSINEKYNWLKIFERNAFYRFFRVNFFVFIFSVLSQGSSTQARHNAYETLSTIC